jgi:hypothetical protein
MIKVLTKEYTKRGIAYHEHVVSLFGIPLFKRIDETTNKDIVSSLKYKQINRVKGFQQ